MRVVDSVFSWSRWLTVMTAGIIMLSGCGAIPAPATGSEPLEERTAPTSTALPSATPRPSATRPALVSTAAPSATSPPATRMPPSAAPAQPAERPAPVPPRDAATTPAVPPQAAQQIAQRAVADLTQRLGIAAEAVEVLSVQQQYKPNGRSDSPGAPDGWLVRLGVGSAVYQYRIGADGAARLLPK